MQGEIQDHGESDASESVVCLLGFHILPNSINSHIHYALH